jgi:N6-adenosine-specific RNA methylase IME4/ParB-like chromosome segregation protein Spo0J
MTPETANGALGRGAVATTDDRDADRIEGVTTAPNDSRQGLQAYRWVHEIEIGERFRKDLGDIASLADSIRQVGLLHPPVITPDNKLIAGRRRLAALEHLHGTKRMILCRIVPLNDIVRGEAAENFARKDFTLSEAVAIKRAIEPEVKAAAVERMKAGAPLPKLDKGRSDDKVSAFTGVKRTTLAKADAVVRAAEAEPEKFGKLVEQMDRTGRADGPYKRLKNVQDSDAIRRAPPGLPMHGPYRTGICDWPWASEPDEDKDHGARGYFPYATMPPTDAHRFRVADILQPNSSVWVWITNHHLMRGDHLTLAKAWGLRPVALLTWVKGRMGQGQRVRGATEHVVQLIRGEVPCLGFDQKTWFEGAGGVHSQKPVEFYDIVEKLTPAPRYFELFSRSGSRPNWDMHGNEVGKHADITVDVAKLRAEADALQQREVAPRRAAALALVEMPDLPDCLRRAAATTEAAS